MSERLHFPESRAEARRVVHRLLDADPDALDPRADLDRLVPNRCPDCGGTNVSEADDEGLIDCLDCGVWFDPLHPANAPGIAGNFPDPMLWKERPVRENVDADDSENPEDFIRRMPVLRPRITITYARTTPESVEDGDFSESGWEDEEGVDMEPDEWDREDGLTAVDKAVKFLKNEGAGEASSSAFGTGVWYSTEWSTLDYSTGEAEERNFHLEDFSPEQEKEIWDKMHERRH